MDLILILLGMALAAAAWWAVSVQRRLDKLEWWVESLEERKADKGNEREVLDGDEWKQGYDDGE